MTQAEKIEELRNVRNDVKRRSITIARGYGWPCTLFRGSNGTIDNGCTRGPAKQPIAAMARRNARSDALPGEESSATPLNGLRAEDH
jgi:hypothetical protein